MNFKPEMLTLLNSAKPFLHPSGQKIVQTTQDLAELLSSPTGSKVMNSLQSLGAQPSTLDAEAKISGSGSNPFSLFLVLYLLILATDKTPNPSSQITPDASFPSSSDPEILSAKGGMDLNQ